MSRCSFSAMHTPQLRIHHLLRMLMPRWLDDMMLPDLRNRARRSLPNHVSYRRIMVVIALMKPHFMLLCTVDHHSQPQLLHAPQFSQGCTLLHTRVSQRVTFDAL